MTVTAEGDTSWVLSGCPVALYQCIWMDAPVNQTHVDRLSGDEQKYRALAAFCTIKERNVQTLFMHENLFSIPNQQRGIKT